MSHCSGHKSAMKAEEFCGCKDSREMIDQGLVRKSGKPAWLRRKLPVGPEYERIRRMVAASRLTTVCREAQCPNQFECYGKGTATFMILGERCSRNCRFCAVGHGDLEPPDQAEPQRVAEAVANLGLNYAVVTSVTRDDLADGGADHFAKTIRAIKERSPGCLVEVLIPDFQGNWDALACVLEAEPDVLNHNIETVTRLYSTVRPQAIYTRSLELFTQARRISNTLCKQKEQVQDGREASTVVLKSGLMLGLGETQAELAQTWADLVSAGCDILTMGQYLQPSKEHLPVERYVPPEEFAELRRVALQAGFRAVAADPFVRSSYQAGELFRDVVTGKPDSERSQR